MTLTLAAVLTVFWLVYVGFSACPRSDFPWTQRRSHFQTRVAFACLAGPMCLLVVFAPSIVAGSSPPDPLVVITGLVWLLAAGFAPAIYFRRASPSLGGSDGDGGGGDPPTDPPPPAAGASGADVPLADAEQSHARLRDHNAARLRRPAQRRPARDPNRRPIRRASAR